MSAITEVKKGTSAVGEPPASHKTRNPLRAINAAMPNVFSMTVLPPVLGPVITTAFTPSGTNTSIGTILVLSTGSLLLGHTSSGCLNRIMLTPSAFVASANVTGWPSSLCEYLARANAQSTRVMRSCSSIISFDTLGAPTRAESFLST